MKEKTKKEKQGHARLFELAGARKNKLTLACLLSVLSSAARIVPFFTIYGVVVELLAHYTAPAEADQGKILALCAITFGAALVYGVCAYASSAISHTAAYEIIYELRLQLMEKLSAGGRRLVPGSARMLIDLSSDRADPAGHRAAPCHPLYLLFPQGGVGAHRGALLPGVPLVHVVCVGLVL